MIATFIGFCVSVLVTFVSPFIQDAGYGNLGGRIGFIYGAFSLAASVWCLFFLPETGRRSLEELDELFENKVSVWQFSRYQTSGYGAQLAEVEDATAHGGEGLEKRMQVIDAAPVVEEGRRESVGKDGFKAV
jgi:SP family sugar:H+ symporter-like MFS transporter